MDRIVVGSDFSFDPVLGSTKPEPAARPARAPARSGRSGRLTAGQVVAGLTKRGVPEHVAQGVVMNFSDESGLSPGINERNPTSGRGGFGLAQWTGPRRRNLENFAASRGKPADDPDTQLDFFMQENAGPESEAWSRVMAAPTKEAAAAQFVTHWERPAEAHRTARVAKYSGGEGSDVMIGGGGSDTIPASKSPSGIERININADYKPEPDTMGDIPGVSNFDPLASVKARQQEQPAIDTTQATPDDPFAQVNAQRVAAGQKPLIAMPASKYDKWREQWEAEQPGIASDIGNWLVSGWSSTAAGVRELVNQVPVVGPVTVRTVDAIDAWAHGGKSSEELLDAKMKEAHQALSAKSRVASEKSWIAETDNPDGSTSYGFGPAWSDPRAYLGGVVESIPGTVLTMVPGGILARASFLKAVAGGAERKVAAAAAARTATIAGSVSEGLVGGGSNAQQTRAELGKVPIETWRQSQAFQDLVNSGMSEDQARQAITENATTQSFLIGGLVDGAFGGLGDRVLAKVIAEGVGGNVVKRMVRGVLREAPAEAGEEAAQSAGEQFGQNVAVQPVEKRPLLKGVGEAAVGGAVTGAAMGTAIGAPAGAISPAEEEPAAPPPPPPPAAKGAAAGANLPIAPAGPLESAVKHGVGELQRTTAEEQQAAAEATPPGAPPIGSQVTVTTDGQTFKATVSQYDPASGDAIVADADTGEVLQIPVANLSTEKPVTDLVAQRDAEGNIVYAPKPEKVEPGEVPAPAEPGPTEVPPAAPKAGETVSKLPPPEAQMPALEKFPGPPKIGQSVIVDAPGIIARTAAKVESYEEGEALVRLPDGSGLQVPLANLYVDKRTKAEVAAAEEPKPVARPKAKGPLVRQVQTPKGETRAIEFPDDLNARLFDIGLQRQQAKKLGGTSQLDLDEVNPSEQQAIADELKISVHDAGQLADDYRYRAQRHAGSARSDLAQKMYATPDKRLKRAQREFAEAKKAAAEEAPAAAAPAFRPGYSAGQAYDEWLASASDADLAAVVKDGGEAGRSAEQELKRRARVPADLEKWWDTELDDVHRKKLLADAGIKRSSKTLWKNFPIDLKSKIAGVKQAPLDIAANEAATSPQNDLPEPTEGQIDAGNYKKGHVRLGGLDISIEHPEGSTRSSKPGTKPAWSRKLDYAHYGQILGTRGNDGELVDAFIKPDTELGDLDNDTPAWVIDQNDPKTHIFDEHKVMIGYDSEADASEAYLLNYPKGWNGFGAITQTTIGGVKDFFAIGAKAPEGATIGRNDLPFSLDAEGNPPAGMKLAQDQEPRVPAPAMPREPTPTDTYGAGPIFPAPKGRPVDRAPQGTTLISQDEADARKARWQEIALKIGDAKILARDGSYGKRAVISLFDASGVWSKPWLEAGYYVYQLDTQLEGGTGEDIFRISPESILQHIEEATGGRDIAGVLAATPCTTFAASGARWWEQRHDVPDDAMVEKLFGPVAAKYFDTPVEANTWLVHLTAAVMDAAKPGFHVMENPIGRIGEMSGLPKPTMRFDPADFGDPYTKRTQLWGEFDTELPIAPVHPSEGSKMQATLRGDRPEDKIARSTTPEGFAYSFFIANDPQAKAMEAEAAAAPAAAPEPAPAPQPKPKAAPKAQPQLQAGAYPNEGKTPIGEHAKAYVVAQGKRTKNEWTVAFDGQGRTRLHQQGTPINSLTPPEFYPALLDKDADLVAHHNHPRSTTISMGDALHLMFPGLSGLWAHGNDGTSSHAQLSDYAARKLKARRAAMTGIEDVAWLRDIIRDRLAPPIDAATAALVKARVISGAEGNILEPLMKMAALDRANYADWMTDIPFPDSWERPEIQQAIDKAANDTAQALYQSLDGIRDGRRAVSARTAGGIAGVLGRDRGSPGRRPAEGVLPEGGEAPAGRAPQAAAAAAPAPATVAVPAPIAVKLSPEGAAAKARLLAKLSKKPPPEGLQEPEDVDPAIMTDGITYAHDVVRSGAVTFDDFARTLLADFGEIGRPYLKLWYMGVKFDPRQHHAGLTSAADVEAADVDAIAPEEVPSAAATEPSDEQRPGLAPDRTGISPAAAGPSGPAQQGAAPAHPPDVGTRQPEDVGEPAAVAGPGEQPGVGAAGQDVEAAGGADVGGPAGDGRPRAGGGGEPDVGAGAGRPLRPAKGGKRVRPAGKAPEGVAAKDPETVSPANPGPGDFHIDDPLRIVGGGQVARFEKNRAAIELRNQLIEEGRKPTREEQELLAGYTGWGSFGQELFQGTFARSRPKEGWEARDKWLRDNLGRPEWEGLQASIINAHYTDPPTVLAMWDMVRRLGFPGGRVLEPSIGIGNFFGMMPSDLTERSQRAGIELDPVTGSMAQLLYPQANIQIKGYEKSTTPDDFYDLVIGNWPFANFSPADRRYNRLNPLLHDYFFLKALDQTRPGGLVVGITSHGTMDKQASTVRSALARKGELVAAFRLPTGAFEQYAGTKVVTDILILRKRAEEKQNVTDEGWIKSLDHPTAQGTAVRINEYYHTHPSHVLGTIDFGHGTTSMRPGMIVHRPDNMAERLAGAVTMVPEQAWAPAAPAEKISYIANHTDDRTNALVKTKAGLHIVQGEYLAPAEQVLDYRLKDPKANAKRVDQLERLISLRKLYGALIDAERSGAAAAPRKALRDAYEAYTKAHGTLSTSYGLDYLRKIDDPFYPALAALEIKTDGKGKAAYRPAGILSESTMRGAKKIANPTIADAFVLARSASINPTPEQIAEIAKRPVDEVRRELIDKGAAFETPGGAMLPSDIYLAGNVREKRRQAQAALAEGNTGMQRNLDALEKVVPADVPFYKIETQMGATWVPPRAYADYIAHMLGLSDSSAITVRFEGGSWIVDFPSGYNSRDEADSGFGVPFREVPFKRLVRSAMANQTITIRRRDADGNYYVADADTKETNAKIAEMRAKFGEWLWSDPERRVETELEYNESRNGYATPKFDGSFLPFQGMALSIGRGPFELRQHQIDAIWRGLVMRKSLNAHEVGSGKTFTMGGIAVESRRYGIAKKPMLLAHNANSKSVAAEIQQMYPGAQILYIDNLSKDNIKIRMQQIANDDWDVIVVPHSVIDRFGFKQETLMAMAQPELDALEQAAIDAAAEDNATLTQAMLDDPEELKKLRSPTAKKLVQSRFRILQRVAKLAQQASRADSIAFEDLGVDQLLIDEAHEFKKPPIATKMTMKGLQTQTSDRSITAQFMTQYIRDMNSGGNVHLFTGTPITNTMTEVFHMMRYIMREEMDKLSLADWDGWFGSFAREIDDIEMSSTGEFEPVTRLQSFINVPELRRMIGQYMDVVFSDDMPEMQPRAVNGKLLSDKSLTEAERAQLLNGRTEGAQDRPYKKVINLSADMTPQQIPVFERVRTLAQRWRSMTKKERREAMLAGAPEVPIIHDAVAEKASFDVRLVDGERNAGKEGSPEMEPHPESKPARVVANLIDLYRSHDKAAQVVFMEQGMSTRLTRSVGPPGQKTKQTYKAFSTLNDMIERLVQAGIPRDEIATVTGATSKDDRKKIAEQMNSGQTRIVFGSTDSLGVGVNMQRNLRAMHHMDAPWMPGELEQRNGRGHRQGNQWNTVLEHRYLTDRLDGRRWQVLALKQRFITDFMKSKGDVRVIEGDAASDEQSDILSTFSEAAGDPRVLIREKLKKRVEQLQSRERIHSHGKTDALRQVRRLEEGIASDEKRIAALREGGSIDAAEALLATQRADTFRATILGQDFTKSLEANEHLKKTLPREMRIGEDRIIGTYGDYPLGAHWDQHDTEPSLYIEKIGDQTAETDGLSMQKLLFAIRAIAHKAGDIEEHIAQARGTLKHMQAVAAEPFHLAPQLEDTRKKLKALQTDIDRNPVAPPFWLRAGAPVDTNVLWNDKEFTVTGHRWDSDGYWVMAEDARGEVAIPYMDVTDAQGMPLYEEHEFDEPKVVAKQPPTQPPTQPTPPGGGFAEPPAAARSKERFPSENRFINAIKSKLTELQPHALGAVYLNYFPELAQPNMGSVAGYLKVKRKMDTIRGKKHAEMDDIAQEWARYARLGPKKAEELADMMHDATIAGVDPDSLERHVVDNQAYPELRARFLAMAPAAQDIYRKVRDAYARQANEIDQILLDNVAKAHGIAERQAQRALAKEQKAILKNPKLSEAEKQDRMREASEKHQVTATRGLWAANARITRLRIALESNRVEPPYFPLGRDGRYFVAARDPEGQIEAFALRRTPGERDQLAKEWQAKYPMSDVTRGLLDDNERIAGDLVKPAFIADIEKMLPQGDDEATKENNQRIMDQIWQRYLRSLPELSTRKKAIHRTKLPGFDRDALKVFANHMFHAAHQMARLKHGLELRDMLDEAKKEGQAAADPTKGTMLANELGKRHKWVMNPQGNRLAQFASSAAFTYYLSASPAAALVNTLQTPMVGIPMLAARFNSGYANAAATLLKASRNVFSNAGLSDTEAAAMNTFEDSGLIDRTQSHDIAGVGETGVKYSPTKQWVMAKMSYMFHKAEVANRRVTALAAYRMARAKGATNEQAIDTAADVTWRTHFDYANSSRPRWAQSDTAKVVLSLRSYQMNMLYRLGRDLHQMFKGATPAQRKEARTQFAGMIAMQALFAGATGVAGYNTAFFLYGIASTIAAALTGGGDGDDPFETETKFRQAVMDLLGPQLGGIALNGLPGTYLGIDLTSRVGMPDLWFRSPNKDLQDGNDAYLYLLDSIAGAPFSIVKQMLDGYDALAADKPLKAWEKVAPKLLKDVTKMAEYGWQGVTNWAGEEVVSPKDINYWELIAQGMGFTPAHIAEKWDQNSTLKNAEKRVKDRRQGVINSYAMAYKMGDAAGVADALADIRRYNQSPFGRTMPISGKTLQRSLKARAAIAAKRQAGGGVLIQNQALGVQLREQLPEAVYQ